MHGSYECVFSLWRGVRLVDCGDVERRNLGDERRQKSEQKKKKGKDRRERKAHEEDK